MTSTAATETATVDTTAPLPRHIPGHRISWSVYAGGYGAPLVRIPKVATMRGPWPGYDAACECGWDSRTGGAVKSSVERDVRHHKYDVTGDYRYL